MKRAALAALDRVRVPDGREGTVIAVFPVTPRRNVAIAWVAIDGQLLRPYLTVESLTPAGAK